LHRVVEAYSLESIALNAASPQMPAPYRLRATVAQRVRRPSLPVATARGILDAAEQIARLAEALESDARAKS